MRATVDNVFSAGPAKALTGPIARGDAALVAAQLRDVAAADPRLGQLYRVLGLWTVELAVRKGTIAADDAARLREALSTS